MHWQICIFVAVALLANAEAFVPNGVMAFQAGRRDTALSALPGLRMADASKCSKPKKLFSWEEARKYARSFGFQSQEEWEEYGCPGAYTLPKRPDLLYVDEWESWEDFLGVMYSFEEGREKARAMQLKSKEEWDAMVARGADAWPDGYDAPYCPTTVLRNVRY